VPIVSWSGYLITEGNEPLLDEFVGHREPPE
jgi:hypothetical protein